MSKMWNCVYSYGNNYTDQKIFSTREKAEEWFDRIMGEEGGEVFGEVEKGDDYMTYHEYDERHPIDVSCLLLEVE